MSTMSDRNWLRDSIKQRDNAESIADSESTHLEVSFPFVDFVIMKNMKTHVPGKYPGDPPILHERPARGRCQRRVIRTTFE